jgi:polar amino acid transport system substrate-binding protein
MKVKKIILFLFLAFTIVLNAVQIQITPKEKMWLNTNQTIRVAVDKNNPPFYSLKNEKYVGISIGYIQYFANKLGLKIKYVPNISFKNSLKKIQTRDDIDVLLKVKKNEKRMKKMLFTKSYINFPLVLISNKSHIYTDFKNVKNVKIALVRGFLSSQRIKADFPNNNFKTYKTNTKALQAINKHEADMYIGDIARVLSNIQKFGFNNLNIAHFDKYKIKKDYMATSKDWPEFISLFDKVYDTIPQDLHVKIKRKYLPFLGKTLKFENLQAVKLTEKEKIYLSKHPVIKVSNELDWYPYDYNKNGKASGYSVDFIKLLAKKIGLKLKFVSAKWGNLLQKFKDGKIDILQPASKTLERENFSIFSNKFIEQQKYIITKKGRADITTFSDLNGKNLALAKKWSFTAYIRTHFKNIHIVEYSTSKEIFESVAFGLTDATIDDYWVAKYIIQKQMLSNLHIVSKVKLKYAKDTNLYMMFHKNQKILQTLFNKALRATSDVEIKKIKQKYEIQLSKKNISNTFNIGEQIYLARKKTINVCIDPRWMPLEMNDHGKYIGMSHDYMKIMENYIGIPIKFIPTKTWSQSLKFAKNRKCDILSLVMVTPKRRVYMNFTKPYITIPLVLVTKLDKIFYSNISSIKGKSLGIVKGYAFGEILRVRYPDMKIVDVKNVDDGLNKVEEGRIFGFIGALATVAYKIQKEHFGSLKISGKFDEKWKLRVATRNDEPLLLSIFNKAINSINKQQHQKILNRWISVQYNKGTDYSVLYKILGILALVVLIWLYRELQLRQYNKKLEILSTTDKLTGIYNRLKLDAILEYEKKLFGRFQRPLSIIMFDLDLFKKVNDNYGHKIGDDVLQTVAKIILKNKRNTDFFGRWGGEEFLVICHETDIIGARALAEKFRKAIEEHEFKTIGSVTASFGVSEFEKYDSIIKVFNKADDALYKAKNSGRNKVV